MQFLKNLFSKPQPIPPASEPEKPRELKKRTTKLVSKKEMVDLGTTSILLKFEDGRELVTRIYGSYCQYTRQGNDEEVDSLLKEPQAAFPTFTPSLKNAEQFITGLSNEESIYTDCPRVPTKSEVGKVITATIIKTEANLQEVTKYSVEPI